MSIYLDSAVVSINGSVIVIVIVFLGALMARYKILDKSGADSLSKLILNLLLPALLFTEMMKSLDITEFEDFGIIFIYCTFHIFIGCAVGWVLSKLSSANKNMTNLIMASIAFQDTTAIPLIFAEVLGRSDVTNPDSNFQEDAVSFVLIYTVFVTVFKWTVAYGMLKKVHEGSLLGDVAEIQVKKSFWWTMKKIMNPPIYATLASIPLALIPFLKQYVFCESGAIFADNVFSALVTVGKTASPLICVLLGSNLSEGYPPTADIAKKHIAVILFGKEVIMPLVGLGLAGGAYFYGIINRVLAISIMIIYAGPTSLQLIMICTTHKNQVDNISKLFLIMYVTAAIPMALWTMCFLILLY